MTVTRRMVRQIKPMGTVFAIVSFPPISVVVCMKENIDVQIRHL